MKKALLLLFLLGIFLAVTFSFKKDSILINPVSQENTLKKEQSNQEPDFSKVSRVSNNNRQYSYLYFSVKDVDKLMLIPNFNEQKSTQKIKEENQCIAGINGGFYNKENKPLGGFVTEGITYKDPVESTLLDGYLWVDKNQLDISEDFNQETSINIQSGPMLFLNGNFKNLSIKNDEFARRSIALKTKEKELIFITIFNYKDLTVGPSLEELPFVLNEIAIQEKFTIESAINLDGGNASSIHLKDFVLPEITHVGSFFCLKD